MRNMSWVVILAALAFGGCRGDTQAEEDVAESHEAGAAQVEPGAAPRRGGVNTDSLKHLTTDSLISLLPTVRGDLKSYGVVVGDLVGEKEVLYALIERGDSILPALADCLPRTESMEVTWEGQPLKLGHLCFVVLNSIAYYEHTDETGDISTGWPGHIGPDTSDEELAEAGEAWQEIIENRWYRTL